MKRQVFILFVVLVFASCVDADKRALSELETATINAENSQIVETKCFLDFEFGMTEKEVNNHFRKLQREGRIYFTRGRYQYDFSFRGMTIHLNFRPEFFDGKLYKITYPCEVDFTGGSGHVFLAVAFNDERTDFRILINTDILGETYYTNYKDNLIATFAENHMIYENAPVSKLVKQQAEEKRMAEYERSKSNF